MKHQQQATVAVVTGASRGIGRAIAMAYAKAGMRVVCGARTQTEIDGVTDTIRRAGGTASAVVCDVTDAKSLQALYQTAAETYGDIHVVVVNAGMAGSHTPLADIDPDEWRQVINLNLIAAMEQCRLAIPHLRKAGGGKLLLMGSGVGRNAMPGTSAYACSKAGLAMLCRVLARELRDHNIAVNEIIPGPVRTRLTGIAEEREGRDEQGHPILSVSDEWIKNPEDVAPIALFLASLPNNGPSGQSFSLNGRDLGRI